MIYNWLRVKRRSLTHYLVEKLHDACASSDQDSSQPIIAAVITILLLPFIDEEFIGSEEYYNLITQPQQPCMCRLNGVDCDHD